MDRAKRLSVIADRLAADGAAVETRAARTHQAAALMAYNLATAEQVQQLSDAANTPQTISPAQVSDAMRPYREGAVNANG